MPKIVLTFNYPEAPLPSYKFGDRVAVTDECAPANWLTGKIIGLTLDESYQPNWYYSVRLDAPSGLTEEYSGDELVPEKQIPALQAEWEANDAAWVKEDRHVVDEQNLSPKFEPGMLVKFTKETRCNLVGEYAEVVSCRYVTSESWSTRFYAPVGLFSAQELSQLGAECLGEFITSPGGSFRYQVASGPLCRIYWSNGKPEPHSFESAYIQDRSGRWKRSHLNYVSYLLVNGEYLTVRWKLPTRCAIATQTKAESRLLRKPA